MEMITGIIAGLIVGLVVVLLEWALVVNRRMFLTLLDTVHSTPDTWPAPIVAANRYELMGEEKARTVLAGRNERDPVVCAILSLLHEAKADAAAESNDPKNPEWLAQRCAGGLHWLMQFEAEMKEALSEDSAAEAEAGDLKFE